MKTYGLFVGISALAFLLAGFQAGLFREEQTTKSVIAAEEKEEKKAEKPAVRARFPQDLAPATRAEAILQAAPFDTNMKIHRMAIVKTNGTLYQDWQEKLREEWQADSIENTELVIVVGPHKKKLIDVIYYPDNSPPISRFQWQVEISVIEAKTGKVLANRLFINKPRQVQHIETWDTTAFGSPVEFRSVFSWAAGEARAGFPPVENPTPIVNVAK